MRHPAKVELASLLDPIWEQQVAESPKHYNMFCSYMAIPASQRSLAGAWRFWTQGSNREGRPISSYYRDLALAWCWAERAAARDMHIITTQQTLWMERDRARREEQFTVGQELAGQAKRAISKIKNLPDEDFRVSLTDAKDVAVAAAQLQETAIPNVRLTGDQIQWVLSQLPQDKRQELMSKLSNAKKQLLISDGLTIDGEVRVITDDDEDDPDAADEES